MTSTKILRHFASFVITNKRKIKKHRSNSDKTKMGENNNIIIKTEVRYKGPLYITS